MPDKPVIYLLPGLLCDRVVWSEQEKALSPWFDVRIPDFRGFDSLRDMALSVLEDAPPRFSVAGHSMGGRVAMELIHEAGNRIDKFAVMDTGVHPVAHGEPEKRRVLLDLADREGLEPVADEWLLPMIHPSRHGDQALVNSIRDMLLRNTVEDYKGQIKALLNRGDQSVYLPRIQQTVLLVCGEQDNWSPVAQHEAMTTALHNSSLVVVKDAGHMVTMEKPDEVNQILLAWFRTE